MKALVIEDDVVAAEALRRGLSAEGYHVEVAHDGVDGLWMATESSADVIVLDVLLPGLNGYRVCRSLREREVWTPVLMLTAKDGEWDEAEGLDVGADDYLVKPYSLAVLLARLRALLRRGATGAPVPVGVGDLHVESRSRRAWRGDVELVLTTRQFEVLEFLVRRAGQVLSKADLLAGVWPDDFDGDPNIVEVYVGRLRRIVDVPFGRRSIETVRGAGYRLVDDEVEEG